MSKFKHYIKKILFIIMSLLLIYSGFVADKFTGLNEAQAQVRKKTTKKTSSKKKSTTKKSARAGSTTKKSTAKKSTTKKSARAGSTTKKSTAKKTSTAKKSTTKKSARAGSTTKKSTAKKTSTAKKSTTKKSARAGTTTAVKRSGTSSSKSSSARSGTVAKVAGGAGSFSSAPKITGTYKSSTAVGSGNKSECVYAYVNCMDALIGYVLNKNPFLGADKTVNNMVNDGKPFRCVFAGANFGNYIPDAEQYKGYDLAKAGGKVQLETKIIETAGFVPGQKEKNDITPEDYMATMIYKKYNYFCEESGVRDCNYSYEGHASYMATEKSIAYYVDVISRIKGGCSNGFIEWPTDEEGETDTSQLKDLEKECKASGGRWNEPNSLKMVDMSSNIMSDLGANQKGTCYFTEASAEVCKAKGGEPGSDGRCIRSDLTATMCQSAGFTWEIEKEWTFAINTPPPSMTLDAGEEFSWASGVCFTGIDFKDSGLVKSKRVKEIEKALKTKGINEDIITDLISKGEDGEDPYIDILVECADVKTNLEQYYMTGVWKEDCSTAEDPTKCTPETKDTNFVTPYKNCLQYEEALKAARVDWKGQATEAIAENGRELERKMKEEEAKDLAADLKTNLTVASMANEVFKQCLSEFKSCMEPICGSGYANCVSPTQGGLVKSKLLDVGNSCYPAYKICMDTVGKTLDVNNMSPQLKTIVLDIQQDPVKMQELVMNSVKEGLGEAYQDALKKTCESAGGFFYDGICAAAILKTNSTAKSSNSNIQASLSKWVEVTTTHTSGGGKNGTTTTTTTTTKQEKVMDKSSKNNSSSSDMQITVGIVLPGVTLTCTAAHATSSKTENVKNADKISVADVQCSSTGATKNDAVGIQADTKAGETVSGTATSSSSCTISEEMKLITATSGTDVDTILQKQSLSPSEIKISSGCGASFVPNGWEQVIVKCNDFTTNRIRFAAGVNQSPLDDVLKTVKDSEYACTPKNYIISNFETNIKTEWEAIFKQKDGK